MTQVAEAQSRLGRILAEGVVIVFSILLAFSIDAWWDRTQEKTAEAEWIAAVQLDLETSIEQLDAVIADAETYRGSATRLLELLRDSELPPVDSVRFLAGASIRPIGFVPTLPGLESGLSEGRLTAIQSVAFRRALADFRSSLTHFETTRQADWHHFFSGPLYDVRAPHAGFQLFGAPPPGRFQMTDQAYLAVMLSPEVYSAFETMRVLQGNQILGLSNMKDALERMVSTIEPGAR